MRVVIVSGHTYTRIHALTSVVAAHETWILVRWYTPVTKSKEHSKQCTSTSEPAPKAAKTMLSARKVILLRFHVEGQNGRRAQFCRINRLIQR